MDLLSTYDQGTLTSSNSQNEYLTTKVHYLEVSETPNSSMPSVFPHMTKSNNKESILQPPQIEPSTAWTFEPTVTSFKLTQPIPKSVVQDLSISMTQFVYESESVNCAMNECTVNPSSSSSILHETTVLTMLHNAASFSVLPSVTLISANTNTDNSHLHASLPTSQIKELFPSNIEIPTSSYYTYTEFSTLGSSFPSKAINPTITISASANTEHSRLHASLPTSQIKELFSSNIEIPTSSYYTYSEFSTLESSFPSKAINPTMTNRPMSDITSSLIGSSFTPLPSSVPEEQDTQTPLHESTTTKNSPIIIGDSNIQSTTVNSTSPTFVHTISTPTQTSTTSDQSELTTSVQTTTMSSIGKTSASERTTPGISAKEKLATATSGTSSAMTHPSPSTVASTSDRSTKEKAMMTSTMVLLDNNITDNSETEMTTQAKMMLASTEPSLNISAVPEEYWVITGECPHQYYLFSKVEILVFSFADSHT